MDTVSSPSARSWEEELAERRKLRSRVRGIYRRILKTIVRFAPGNGLRVFLLRCCGFKIGEKVRVGEDLQITELIELSYEKLVIGDRVALASGITFVTSSGPSWSRLQKVYPSIDGKIVVEDDAWIGARAVILPNVTIGEGAVVGAGAVVIKDVPPYTVVVGVPARPIKRISLETGEIISLEASDD